MIDSLPKPFPALDVSEDRNPAMRLFGLRFFQDQTVLEYLTGVPLGCLIPQVAS